MKVSLKITNLKLIYLNVDDTLKNGIIINCFYLLEYIYITYKSKKNYQENLSFMIIKSIERNNKKRVNFPTPDPLHCRTKQNKNLVNFTLHTLQKHYNKFKTKKHYKLILKKR